MKVTLTPEQQDVIRHEAYAVWNEIASDAYEMEGRMTQGIAIELILDANRLEDNLARSTYRFKQLKGGALIEAERAHQFRVDAVKAFRELPFKAQDKLVNKLLGRLV